jgi:SAM-dependent methyltransferase
MNTESCPSASDLGGRLSSSAAWQVSEGSAVHVAALEALLYDWHNARRLIDQQADVGFWLAQTRSSTRTLVLGAGTGRVASPLAEDGTGFVVALDRNPARLGRIGKLPRLALVCGDMRQIPLRPDFEAIVIPYSAFQLLPSDMDRRQAVKMAARLLTHNGVLHIDVSTSFEERPPSEWQVVLEAHCDELDENVIELERCSREADALVIHKEFRSPSGQVLCAVEERWSYFYSIGLEALLNDANLVVANIDWGYGEGKSMHRQVFHASHRTRSFALLQNVERSDR